MSIVPKAASDSLHDETLVDWFLSLQPIERLAELESRLEFFNAVHRCIEALIEEKKALGRDKNLAAVRLLEAVLRRRR